MTDKLTPRPIPRTRYSRHDDENAAYNGMLDRLDKTNTILAGQPLGTCLMLTDGFAHFLLETKEGLIQMKSPVLPDEGLDNCASAIDSAEYVEGLSAHDLNEISAIMDKCLQNLDKRLIKFDYQGTLKNYEEEELRISQRSSLR